MSNFKFVTRIFDEELEKFRKIKPEFEERGVIVDDLEIALLQKRFDLQNQMVDAISTLNENERKKLIAESQTFCSETRRRIDELSFEKLNKRYL